MFSSLCVSVYRGQKRVSNPLELQLKSRSYELSDIAAGDQTLVLCENSKCS
ncbi:hypothetical protein I79_012785 [Cricetulus griseus]|uniref:Uncharacterized protein n=1 Tax=Cricetulus griseus TaxID=10029 RepID=G3HPR8_CRIGR|nr:hypothetical protein I79_012785 [Cricetulus griseus]